MSCIESSSGSGNGNSVSASCSKDSFPSDLVRPRNESLSPGAPLWTHPFLTAPLSLLGFRDMAEVFQAILSLYEPALQIYAALWIAWILSRYSPFRQVPGLKTILEACLFNWTAILAFPIYPTGFSIFYSCRWLVSRYCRWVSGGKVFLMPGSDAVWGTESFANACNFTSLYVLEGKCCIEKIRKRISTGVIEKEVNGERIYDKLRWRAGTRLSLPVWEVMDTFDISNHVRYLHYENEAAADGKYSEDDVFEEISKFFDHPLTTEKPQWECYIVPNYIYNDSRKTGNYYALIFR